MIKLPIAGFFIQSLSFFLFPIIICGIFDPEKTFTAIQNEFVDPQCELSKLRRQIVMLHGFKLSNSIV